MRDANESEREHRKVRAKKLSTVSAGAGGIVGGLVAVLMKVLGGGVKEQRCHAMLQRLESPSCNGKNGFLGLEKKSRSTCSCS